MANIYSRVEFFYQENPEAEAIVPQEKVEQYFRRRAWHAASSHDMEMEWRLFSLLIEYIDQSGFYSFDSLAPVDYEMLLYRARERWHDFPLDDAGIERAFDALRDFYKIALPEAEEELFEILNVARKTCLAKKEELFPREGESLLAEDDLSEEDIAELNRRLDGLLRSVQIFYKDEKHLPDLARAIFRFCGPEMSPEDLDSPEKKEEFWHSFWDYFLFDYHMIDDDNTPLHAFFVQRQTEMDWVDRKVVQDLMRSRFTIFYVVSIGDESVLCRDLFTDEDMVLPLPDVPMADYDKVLLYGHMHARDTMLLNHICSVPATKKLRHRIKEEIQRQFDIYRWRSPQASFDEFFARNTAAVLHVIHLMTSLAQLRVVPMLRPRRKQSDALVLPQNFAAPQQRLERNALALGIGAEERGIIQRIYADFVRQSSLSLQVKKRGDTLAAAITVFLIVNSISLHEEDKLCRLFRTTPTLLVERLREMLTALDCILFDPRYLSEQGFINALFMELDTQKKE